MQVFCESENWFVFRRKRRDTSSTEEPDTDEDMLPTDAIGLPEPAVIPGPEGLHMNDTWPTASGTTQEAATASCEAPILASPIFDVCDPYTEISRQDIINSCVLDILVSQ